MEKDQALQALRTDIDAIDDALLDLLSQRAKLALATSEFKTSQGTCHIHSATREKEIFNRVKKNNAGCFKDEAIIHIFETIIAESRQLQQQHLHHQTTEKIVISIMGDKGSFSEMAADQFCRKRVRLPHDFAYAITSDNVMQALQAGEADYGVLAINNAWAGLVTDSVTALASHRHRIIDMISIPVQQCLLIQPGQDPGKIHTIISHEKALQQCRNYLKKNMPECEWQSYDDTALAARDLAAGKLPENSAIIASESAAKQFNLHVLNHSIQDLNNNDTLFIVIRCHDINDQQHDSGLTPDMSE